MAKALLIFKDKGDDVEVSCENVASDNQTPAQICVAKLLSKIQLLVAELKLKDDNAEHPS